MLSDFYRHKLDFSVFQGFDIADRELIQSEIAAYAAREVTRRSHRLSVTKLGIDWSTVSQVGTLPKVWFRITTSKRFPKRDVIRFKSVEGALAAATNWTPQAIHARCVGELFFEVDEIRLMSKVRLDKYLEGVCQQRDVRRDQGTSGQPAIKYA